MTQEIIEMARDSGMELYGLGKDRARFVHHLEAFAKLVAEKALAEHAMREVQRLGQEIEQEPVGEVSGHDCSTGLLYRDLEPGAPLYTAPPQRTQPNDIGLFWRAVTTPEKWVGLTVDEILSALESVDPETKRLPKGFADFAYAVEAKLKEKNCG